MHRLKPANAIWNDVNQSLVNAEFGDIYFQGGQGMDESRHVFLESNNLPRRFAKGGRFQIGECGFGSGLNFLLTWKLWLETAPPAARLHYFSIENRPLPPDLMAKVYAQNPAIAALGDTLLRQYPPPFAGIHTIALEPGNVTLTLYFGEAEAALRELDASLDAWFLDGFAPAKNPDIWQDDLLTHIARNTKTGGTFATFTAAGAVRRGLETAGFAVTKTKGYGRKREMLTGIRREDGKKPSAPSSALILGAGIAGCSAAAALARAGLDVTLIEGGEGPAARTSGNPAGLVYPKLTAAPSPAGDFYLHAFLFARRLLDQIPEGVFKPCGVLHLALDDEDKARHQKIAALADDPELARVLEPAIACAVSGIHLTQPGLFMAQAGYIHPPEFCRHLAGRDNIKIMPGAEIARLAPDENGWAALDTQENIVARADCAVIAAGPWAQKFLPSLPLEYLRGQVSFLGENENSGRLKAALCHDGYVTPALNGLHYAGATFDKSPEPSEFSIRDEDHTRNIEKLSAHIPALFGQDCPAIQGGRTGYRTALPDRLPLADAVPGQRGLFALVALGSHGMTTAPILGELIAARILQTPLPLTAGLIRHLSFGKIRARA